MNNTQKIIKYLVTFLALMLIFFIVYIPFMFISSAINGIHKVLFDTLPSDLIVENAELDNLDFSKISIDVSSSNITVNDGSKFNVKSNNDKIKFEVIGDTLYVKETGNRRKSNDYKLNLTIPKEMINLLNVKVSNGNINVENVIINELNIDIKHGDVNIDNSIFNETSSNLKMGNFNFDGKINESIYINNNIGDITLMVNDNIENYKVNTTNILISFVYFSFFKLKSIIIFKIILITYKNFISFHNIMFPLKIYTNRTNFIFYRTSFLDFGRISLFRIIFIISPIVFFIIVFVVVFLICLSLVSLLMLVIQLIIL